MSAKQANETGHVRDKRNGKWWWCHNAVIDQYGPMLGPHGLAVYAALCRYANDDGACWPSIATIGHDTGMSPNRVRRSLADLERNNLISIERRADGEVNLTSIYTLLDVEESSSQRSTTSPQAVPTSPREVPLLHGVKEGTSPREAKEDSKKKTQLEQDSGKREAASAAPPPSPPSQPVLSETVPPPPPKRASRVAKETPEETAYYAACVPVVARVCRIDLQVPGEWARCKKPLQALYHATVRPTPDLLALHYEMPAGYWYTRDFRGQKGETPEPHWIQNTWGKAVSPAPRVVPSGNGHARAAPPQEDGIAALRARLTGQDPTGTIIEGRFKHG